MEFEEENLISIKKCWIEEYDKAFKELELEVGFSKIPIFWEGHRNIVNEI